MNKIGRRGLAGLVIINVFIGMGIGIGMGTARPAVAVEPARAESAAPDVGWEQRLGQTLPSQVLVKDEQGQTRPLTEYLGPKPVVLTFAYYQCPNLCTLVLNGLSHALRLLPQKIGQDYEVITLSIDPQDTPARALMKKRTYLATLGLSPGTSPESPADWHFLVASPAAVAAITKAAGFDFRFDAAAQQFAHPSGLVVLSADGVIRQYMMGIRFDPHELGAAIDRAAQARTGNPVEQILLFCFHYDPAAHPHGAWILAFIRALAGVGALGLGIGVARAFYREART